MSKLNWKSRRLTNSMRVAITQRVKCFLSETKAAKWIAFEEYKLVNLIYCHEVSPEYRSVIARLPEDFFTRRKHITVNVMSEGVRHLKSTLALSKGTFALPAYLTSCLAAVEVKAGTELADKLMKFATKRESFEKKTRELVRDVEKILRAANTEARLVEMWPEAVKYLLPPEGKPKHPPVPVADIKKRMSEFEI